jgi:hypothetical protein
MLSSMNAIGSSWNGVDQARPPVPRRLSSPSAWIKLDVARSLAIASGSMGGRGPAFVTSGRAFVEAADVGDIGLAIAISSLHGRWREGSALQRRQAMGEPRITIVRGRTGVSCPLAGDEPPVARGLAQALASSGLSTNR